MNIRCKHCHLSFDEKDMLIDENGDKFCCNGCKQVYSLLKSQGLDGEFYTRLGKNVLTPAKQSLNSQSVQTFYKNFVTTTADGFSEIYLVIDQIHCAACIWLNEKVLSNLNGVIEVYINSTNNKARILWNDDELNLSEILHTIKSIGYIPNPYDPSRQEAKMAALRREFYSKLLVGIFCTMNIMWIAIALYSGYFTGISPQAKAILTFAEFLLASPALFYTGSEFFKGAYYAIKNRYPSMDLLVASGASLAYAYSVYAMLTRTGEVYFESVAMIITFVFIGKYLETLSKKRATDTLDALSAFVVGDVRILVDKNITKTAVNEIKPGDIALISSGERALCDGVVKFGEASFDMSSLSGESVPVLKKAGDEILSGSICIDGHIEYEIKKGFSNSTLSKIINLLENASAKKPKIEILANQISGYFSIIILTLTAATFCGWFYYTGGFEKALIVSISVLVIACPCALGLATPVSALVGLGVGLGRGVIFKQSRTLESLAKCGCIVFDKTGTLTTGKLSVVEFKSFDGFDEAKLMALLKSSNHPVSLGVYEYAKAKFTHAKSIRLDEIKTLPAKGMSGVFDGEQIYGGSGALMDELEIKHQLAQNTSYYFAQNGHVTAQFELRDSIRDDAKSSVNELKQMGFEIYILSGDNEKAVKFIADELDIKEAKAEVLPTQKAKFIQSLTKSGKNVIMVGDGINDAAALSLASVGICLGGGAETSIDKSDVVLMRDSLSSLNDSIKISKRSYLAIKENIAFSILYNATTIPLAISGHVIPLVAAASMSLSSLVVVLNALRIRASFKENL